MERSTSLQELIKSRPWLGPAALPLLWLAWRAWRFSIIPALYPDEPKELPYWIPGALIYEPSDNRGMTDKFALSRSRQDLPAIPLLSVALQQSYKDENWLTLRRSHSGFLPTLEQCLGSSKVSFDLVTGLLSESLIAQEILWKFQRGICPHDGGQFYLHRHISRRLDRDI